MALSAEDLYLEHRLISEKDGNFVTIEENVGFATSVGFEPFGMTRWAIELHRETGVYRWAVV